MQFTKGTNADTFASEDTRFGTDTSTAGATSIPSKVYQPLTLATDISDERGDEKPIGSSITWSRHDEEANIALYPVEEIATPSTIVASQPSSPAPSKIH